MKTLEDLGLDSEVDARVNGPPIEVMENVNLPVVYELDETRLSNELNSSIKFEVNTCTCASTSKGIQLELLQKLYENSI